MSVKHMTAIWDMDLPPTDKLVLLAVADWARDDGSYCWPSISTIAKKSGVSERTVQRTIRAAEAAGILTRKEEKGKGCRYLLHPRQPVTPDTVSPVTNEAPTPDTVSPNTLGTIRPKKDKPSLDKRPRDQFPAPDGVEDQVWRDFLASPKRRKAGMNATAYAGICRNLVTLAEHGFPPGEMIALAVERGWTTVKLEWVLNDGRSNGNGMAGNRRDSSGDGLSPTTRAAVAVFGAGQHGSVPQ